LEESLPTSATPLLTVLREALASGHHPVDAILRAIADTARILTGANGTAIALQTNDVVVCRARSGDQLRFDFHWNVEASKRRSRSLCHALWDMSGQVCGNRPARNSAQGSAIRHFDRLWARSVTPG